MTSKTTLAQQYALDAYRLYGQYVVGNRAVADYRDGLKPVQRRILWAMHKLGLHHGSKFSKSARTVGEVLGKYHPHGDASVYDALVGLVVCRYPLVEGKGNFGSLTDPAAAYRYTEARLHQLAQKIIGSDDSIMQLQPNFDDQEREPVVMPAELPFLLLNGCSGIAVGITSEIPPHNASEILGLCCKLLVEGDITDQDIIDHVRGPDYGCGVLLSPPDQVLEVYRKGEGQLSYRCQYHYDGNKLIITSFAPRFNIPKFIETCGKYVEAGNLLSVSDVSAKKSQIEISFSNPRFVHDHVLPLLETSISYRFFVNESSPDGAKTMQMGLHQLIASWLAFRVKNEKRIIKAEIQKINQQIFRAEAKKVGAINLKKIAAILSEGKPDMEQSLIDALSVTAEVVKVILDTPLRSLAKLQVEQLDREIAEFGKEKADAESRLQNVNTVVAEKLKQAITDAGEDTRGTLVGQKRPKLELPANDEVQTWVACSRDGKVLRLEEAPDKRRASLKSWDQLIQTGPFLWVVMASGQMQRVDTASLVVGKPKNFGELAGIISSAAPRIAVMDEHGEGIVIDSGTLMKDKYQSLKTDAKVVRAFGMNDASLLAAWNEKAVCVHGTPVDATRVNSGGWKFLPKYKKGATEALSVHHSGNMLVLRDGKLTFGGITVPDFETVASGRCYVELEDGTKLVGGAKTVAGVVGGNKVIKLLSIG